MMLGSLDRYCDTIPPVRVGLPICSDQNYREYESRVPESDFWGVEVYDRHE